MIKLAINGYYGRMGQTVAKEALKDEKIEVIYGIDKIQKENPYNVEVVSSAEEMKQKPDVIIDFSIPKATFEVLEYAKQNKVPMVIATTGFSEEEIEKIKEISKEIPIFRSSNMSFDINLMSKIVAEVAKKLQDSDIEIIETHHNRKIDSPSGTAILLADAINNALDNKMHYEFDRHSKREKRSKDEIGFSSIRGGNIVGEHTVQFYSENETFEIKHTSYSSSVFAEGAIKAAKYVASKDAGLYNMDALVEE
ncbi:MAG: 4-hydroxy-tetrahydrodipicolinate reductase [Clostridia bacterium]|nr:4-hydroxy-tetrahydrodipicolinate reductase [Clostridia bacterium]